LHQVGDLFELDVKFRCQKVKVTCDDTMTHGDKVTHEKVSRD